MSQFKFENALHLLERDFSVQETLSLLKSVPSVFFSWGPHKFTVINSHGYSAGKLVEKEKMERGLVFAVQGFKLKGWVLITLDWVDVYAVHFFNQESVLLESLPGVYADMLLDCIDEYVERDEKFYGK